MVSLPSFPLSPKGTSGRSEVSWTDKGFDEAVEKQGMLKSTKAENSN